MRKNYSLFAFGIILFAVLACRTFQRLSSRETLFEGSNMKEAAAAFKEKAGGPIQAISLEVEPNKATLRAQDSKQPDHVNEYRYSIGLCTGPYPVNVATLDPFQQNLKASVFPLDEVDLAATPQTVKAALARVKVEGGKVTKIVIERGRNLANFTSGSSQQSAVRWQVEVEGPRESASVTANTKGEIVGVDLSRTARANKQDYFDPQALADAVRQIKQEFGGQVYLALCDVSKDRISFLAASSPTTDELHRYQYDLSGIKRNLADTGPDLGPKYRFKNHEFYFTFDEIDFGKTSQVLKTAFEKSGFAHPIIPSMDFRRPWEMSPDRVNPVEWRVIVKDQENFTGKGTYVTFDAKGNFLRKQE